jgi:hypothetical protein
LHFHETYLLSTLLYAPFERLNSFLTKTLLLHLEQLFPNLFPLDVNLMGGEWEE